MSRNTANFVDTGLSVAGCATAIWSKGLQATTTVLKAPPNLMTMTKGGPIAENFRSFTKRNCRENLKRLTGKYPSGKEFEAHHILAQEFEELFIKRGINIHNPKYLTWWETSSHRLNAKAYNDVWREFIKDNPGATQTQMLEAGKRMMTELGIPTYY